MGKLNELQVDRTDAVDRPATGHRWMILKSENAETPDVAATARAALEALAKEEGLALSDESAEALRALAGELEIEGFEFKATEKADDEAEADVEKDADEDADDEPEAAAEDVEKDADEGEQDGEAEAEAEVEKDAEKVEVELEDGTTALVEKSVLATLIGEAILQSKVEDEDEQMSTPLFRRARSKQPSEDEVEKGERKRDLHASWVFGQ